MEKIEREKERGEESSEGLWNDFVSKMSHIWASPSRHLYSPIRICKRHCGRLMGEAVLRNLLPHDRRHEPNETRLSFTSVEVEEEYKNNVFIFYSE